MVDSVEERDGPKIVWVNAFQTRDVEAELPWLRTPLVVGINAANGTKVVLGCFRIPLIQGELLSALQYSQTIKRY